jgi:hypothetical protein
MNFFNKTKNVDFPITLGGLIGIDFEDFLDIIIDNTEEGCTYRFIVKKDGNPLTKDGVPIDSLLCTIPTSQGSSIIEYILANNCILDLHEYLEKIISGSDYLKEIYAENNITIPGPDPDATDNEIEYSWLQFEHNLLKFKHSLLENYKLNLSLSITKCNE